MNCRTTRTRDAELLQENLKTENMPFPHTGQWDAAQEAETASLLLTAKESAHRHLIRPSLQETQA